MNSIPVNKLRNILGNMLVLSKALIYFAAFLLYSICIFCHIPLHLFTPNPNAGVTEGKAVEKKTAAKKTAPKKAAAKASEKKAVSTEKSAAKLCPFDRRIHMDKRIKNMNFFIAFQNLSRLSVIVFALVNFCNQDTHNFRIRHILNPIQEIEHIGGSKECGDKGGRFKAGGNESDGRKGCRKENRSEKDCA